MALGADRHVEEVVAAGSGTAHPWFFGPRHVKLLEGVSAGMLSEICRQGVVFYQGRRSIKRRFQRVRTRIRCLVVNFSSDQHNKCLNLQLLRLFRKRSPIPKVVVLPSKVVLRRWWKSVGVLSFNLGKRLWVPKEYEGLRRGLVLLSGTMVRCDRAFLFSISN